MFFDADAIHKRGLCRHTVSAGVSVCLSLTFVYSAETGKHILKLFSPSGRSHTNPYGNIFHTPSSLGSPGV